MDKLKEHIATLICSIATITTWFFDELDTHIKIIVTLSAFLISLSCYTLKIYKRYKTLSDELDNVNQNHKALSDLFNKKQEIIRKYESASISIERLLGICILNTKETKIKGLSESIMFYLNNIK